MDVLEQKMELGQNILIADSIGFIEAPGLAEFLAKQGKIVQVLSYHPNLASELKLINHYEHLFRRLYAAKVTITNNTWIRKIEDRSVLLYNVYYPQDERWLRDVDNIVLITGKEQNDSLYYEFKDKVKDVYLVGDADLGGARLMNAFYEAQTIARAL